MRRNVVFSIIFLTLIVGILLVNEIEWKHTATNNHVKAGNTKILPNQTTNLPQRHIVSGSKLVNETLIRNEDNLEELEIDGETFQLIMDPVEYSNLKDWISKVGDYGAHLYGIPNSDVFAVVKNGKVIAQLSVGVMFVLKSEWDLASKMFADKLEGLSENIQKVERTNESVFVELDSYSFYEIRMNKDMIEIYYELAVVE